MPWRETSPMEQRLEFVREYETELFTMTELAAQYGISRKTGYKWLAQYEAEGVVGLLRSLAASASQSAGDRCRRSSRRCSRCDGAIRAGAPKKLLAVAARRCGGPRGRVDRRSCTLLKQHGLGGAASRRRDRRRRRSVAAGAITAPNQVSTTDFKGEFRTGDGVYCYPLTLRDGFSRFVLRCDAFLGRTDRGHAPSL